MAKYKNLLGEKFERLTVIEFSHTDKNNAYWKCRCDCGNEIVVSRQSLQSKYRTSCGCLKKEKWLKTLDLVHQLNKKPSEIIVKDNYAEVKLSNCDKVALVDIEDIPKIKGFCWHIKNDGYVATNDKSSGKYKQLKLHKKIIDNVPNNMEIDHINQSKLDNRKCNLRVVTPMQNTNNNYNSEPRSFLKLKYIYYNKKYGYYIVKYRRYGQDYYVGCYHSIEEAKENLKRHLIKNNFKELIQWEK